MSETTRQVVRRVRIHDLPRGNETRKKGTNSPTSLEPRFFRLVGLVDVTRKVRTMKLGR